MNGVQDFIDRYGAPAPGSASSAVTHRLAAHASGKRLLEATGAGAFDDGFLTLASLREEVDDLAGWEHWLPPGALWYASSALGVLYVAAPDGCMWLVNTQVGSVMQTAFPLDEAFARTARRSTSDEFLMRPLFREWAAASGPLGADRMLLSSPPAIELGFWDWRCLVPITSARFLDGTAALFEPRGPTPISVMEPGN